MVQAWKEAGFRTLRGEYSWSYATIDVKVSGVPKEKVRVKVNIIDDDTKKTKTKNYVTGKKSNTVEQKSKREFRPIPTL